MYSAETNVEHNVKDDIRKSKEKCKLDHKD